MSDVEEKVTIAAPPEKVWAAPAEPLAIAAWMDDDSAQIDLHVGEKYAVFGGDTTGGISTGSCR
jgi:uncharacterized protein YndB with AHSA1/START domain